MKKIICMIIIGIMFIGLNSVEALEQTPDYCFVVKENAIIGYECYEGNTNGYPTITDVVIPKQINGVDIYEIKSSTEDNYPKNTHNLEGLSQCNLTSIVLPDTIKSIGNYAFTENNITKIDLPLNLETIGAAAFAHNKLNELVIPDSVETIGNSAFSNNELKTLKISNNVKMIGISAFANNLLTSVEIPSSLTEISGSLFENNQLEDVVIPNGITKINYGPGNGSFKNNKLKKVIIPDSVELIGYEAFANNNIVELKLSNNLKTIGSDAFKGNSISNLILPKSVTNISEGSFYDNDIKNIYNLTSISDSHILEVAINNQDVKFFHSIDNDDKMENMQSNSAQSNDNISNPKTLDFNNNKFIIIGIVCSFGILFLVIKFLFNNKKVQN